MFWFSLGGRLFGPFATRHDRQNALGMLAEKVAEEVVRLTFETAIDDAIKPNWQFRSPEPPDTCSPAVRAYRNRQRFGSSPWGHENHLAKL